MPRVSGESWTYEATLKLRDLWMQGMSASKIARELAVTKNSVVGKSRRMGLERRKNPVSESLDVGGRPFPSRPHRAGARPSLPPLPSERLLQEAPKPVVLPPEPVVPATFFKPLPMHECCWPFGTPRTPGFRYCDAPAPAGRSYCAEHDARAYSRGHRAPVVDVAHP